MRALARTGIRVPQCAWGATQKGSAFSVLLDMAASKFKYESCSLQVRLPEDYTAEIQEWSRKHISNEVLYEEEDGTYGRDEHSHLTICLGLKEADLDKYIIKAETLVGTSLSTKSVQVWETNKFDLFCISLLPSYELTTLNEELTKLADPKYARSTFKPHISIAFVKKGLGKKIMKELSWHDRHVIEEREWLIAEHLELVNREGRFLPITLPGSQE